MNESSTRARWSRLAAVAVVALGALLRFAGLSHDLHEGHNYHPDTPKQVRAAERYLDGRYFFEIGHHDYDGYPYFTSHLIEWTVRAGLPVVRAARSLAGLPVGIGWPPVQVLSWVGRVLNALLASLLVLLVYRAARREWGDGAGLLAGLLLALSPADIAACHYEAGDTPASFFATLAVLAALRILRDGRAGQVAAGTFFAVCAFAAKYHGALAGVAVAMAFAVRQPGRWGWIATRAAWRGWMLMAAVAVASVFATIPAMFIHPVRMVEHIHGFLEYASNFHVPPEVAGASGAARLFLSLKLNLPKLAALLGAPTVLVCLGAAAALARGSRRALVLAALPLLYIVVALGLRAASHPVYHTLITPTLFIIAAAAVTSLRRRAAAVLVAAAAVAWLVPAAQREAYFFRQPDTRLLARAWVEENLPPQFSVISGAYTFHPAGFAQADTSAPARVWVNSSIRSSGAPKDGFLFKQFRLEAESLPLFRNPTLELYVGAPRLLREGYRLPVFQSQAGTGTAAFAFEPLTGIAFDSRAAVARGEVPAERTFVVPWRVDEALAVVRAGAAPAVVDLRLGCSRRTLPLAAGGAAPVHFQRPHPAGSGAAGSFLYRGSASAAPAEARVIWAFTDAEKGVALWQAGLDAEAAPYLLRAARAEDHLTLAVMARLAAAGARIKLSAEDAARLDDGARDFMRPWTAERVFERYGIAPAYLEELPYLRFDAADFRAAGFEESALEEDAEETNEVARTSVSTNWLLRSPSFTLPPGAYAVTISGGAAGASTTDVALVDFRGVTRAMGTIAAGRSDGAMVFSWTLDEELVSGWIEIRGAEAGFRVSGLRIRPDVVRTLDHLGAAWRVVAGREGACDRADPTLYDAWLMRGDAAAGARRWGDALDALAQAQRLGPDRAEAVRALAALAPQLRTDAPPVVAAATGLWATVACAHEAPPLRVPFGADLQLDGFRLASRELRAGGTLGLNLYWSALRPGWQPRGLGAWVHILNEQGKVVFQADRSVDAEWRATPQDERLAPALSESPIPTGVPPGRYRIVVGAYPLDGGKRLDVRAPGFATHKHGLVLPVEIVIR